jgi:hypothetical protein
MTRVIAFVHQSTTGMLHVLSIRKSDDRYSTMPSFLFPELLFVPRVTGSELIARVQTTINL